MIDNGRTEMQRMLGNAVLPLAAEVLAREIRRLILLRGLCACRPARRPGESYSDVILRLAAEG